MPLFHRPSNKISDLRSVETPPVHSSTQFQHLIIFSAAVACRFFSYHLGCCCFFFSFTHTNFISKGLYQGHFCCFTITMGYCYSCLLYNFHFILPNSSFQTIRMSIFSTTRIYLKQTHQIFPNRMLIS